MRARPRVREHCTHGRACRTAASPPSLVELSVHRRLLGQPRLTRCFELRRDPVFLTQPEALTNLLIEPLLRIRPRIALLLYGCVYN